MATTVKVKRGTDAQRLGYTPLLGELVYAQDTKEVYIGDGVQVGGIPINGNSVLKTTINQNNGVAGLDATGKLNPSVIPAIALSETYVVADIAARDALTVQVGDVAIVTDAGGGNAKSFIYDSANTWQELKTPTAAVASVAGRTGAVTLTTADLTDFNVAGATAGQAILWDGVSSKWKATALPAGVSKFVQLSDVGNPAANGGKVLSLNAAGTAVEYLSVIDGGVF